MNDTIQHNKVGGAAKALCMLSLALACAPAWSGSKEPKYTMTLFADEAQGSSILDGDYKHAIKKINAKLLSKDRFQVETNLCVAYTKSGDLEAAEEACEAAVVAAESGKSSRHVSSFDNVRYVAQKKSVAIALSNRGVLKAVKGELDSARQDFDAAIDLRAGISAPKTNLERLNVAVAADNTV
jgi:tetratricopeptide (TPR) repeat protein